LSFPSQRRWRWVFNYWDVTAGINVSGYHRFGRKHRIHLQG
jgi:hypothetical protein